MPGGLLTSHDAYAEVIKPHSCSNDEICYPNDATGGYNAEELKTIGKDLSDNGNNSVYYSQFKSYMDSADTSGNGDKRGTMKLTTGETAEFRLIGINGDNGYHDPLASNPSKNAGLTFMMTNVYNIPSIQMFTSFNTVNGGWRDSNGRKMLNNDNGSVYSIIPESLKKNISPVLKITHNAYGTDKRETATSTIDKLWLLSYTELVGRNNSYWKNYYVKLDGDQYSFFNGKVTNNYDNNSVLNSTNIITNPDNNSYKYSWWGERSASPIDYYDISSFLLVDYNGYPSNSSGANRNGGAVFGFSF